MSLESPFPAPIDVIPHRKPFLYLDEVTQCDGQTITGTYRFEDEPFFEGHFPGTPIMPGVLQIEALAQTGGVLLLNTVSDPQNYLTFFMKIDKVKFKRTVVPGDTLIFKLELIAPIRRGICQMLGQIYCNDNLITEGEFMAQMIRKENK